VPAEYEVDPLVDLLAFRDLSYVPVKGIYMTSYAAGDTGWMTKMLDIADTTEINAFVIDVKDDRGWVAYEADVPWRRSSGSSRGASRTSTP